MDEDLEIFKSKVIKQLQLMIEVSDKTRAGFVHAIEYVKTIKEDEDLLGLIKIMEDNMIDIKIDTLKLEKEYNMNR